MDCMAVPAFERAPWEAEVTSEEILVRSVSIRVRKLNKKCVILKESSTEESKRDGVVTD